MNLKESIANWKKRHRNRTSFWLHMAGIPACFVVAPVLLVLREGWLAMAFFVGGYALQFIGHLVEGNRSGEEELVRRLFTRISSRKAPPGGRKGGSDEKPQVKNLS